ncbi:MAG: hypothetical protein KL787_06475 [Taibaiella sp.]|nr:hypothetical protein [Taibaiella sp.]
MVDCLIQFTPDSATSQWEIQAGNIFVTDGGMMDSYGLMEHIAQTAALHKGYEYYLDDRQPPVGYLAEIKKQPFFACRSWRKKCPHTSGSSANSMVSP